MNKSLDDIIAEKKQKKTIHANKRPAARVALEKRGANLKYKMDHLRHKQYVGRKFVVRRESDLDWGGTTQRRLRLRVAANL